MATKKKEKKSTKSKLAVRKKAAAKPVAKRKTHRVLPKRTKSKTRSRNANATTANASPRPTRPSKRPDTAAFAREAPGSHSGEQSGDLQGLRYAEGANSESVGELVEEGNAFEADVVTGVEDAEDAGEREVHTHEVPEDDVPDEYLDKE
jgi:hypothetical protein